MVFGRRKSSAPADVPKEENEIRAVRNRLTKPQTIKSAPNLPTLAAQDAIPRTNTGISERVAMLVAPKAGDIEARKQIRTHLSESDTVSSPNKSMTSETSWSGVAYMINKFENNQVNNKSPQPPPIAPPKTRRPLSVVFGGRRFSGNPKVETINTAIKDKPLPFRNESPHESTLTPVERLVDSPLIPSSRRASFAPGTATRKPNETPTPPPEPKIEVEEPAIPTVVEEEEKPADQLSFTGGDDEDWFPPPQMPRTETPQSLDYTHLGSLRLGSLHVINGRASPTLSALSKNPLSHVSAATREISSEYGESVYDSIYDEPSQHGQSSEPQTPQPVSRRDFSWTSNRSSRFDTLDKLVTPKNARQAERSPDRASMMAAEYMAELPASPYSVGKSSPVEVAEKNNFEEMAQKSPSPFPLHDSNSPASVQRKSSFESLQKSDPVIPVKRSRVESSSRFANIHKSPSVQSLRRSVSSCSLRKSNSRPGSVRRSISPISSIHSSTGSVLRINTTVINFNNPAFEDEAIGHPSDPERSTLASWHSPIEPIFTHEEAFSSAVEFQTPPSPQRQPSPLRLEPPQPTQQSDSGYSSNNSLRSFTALQKVVSQPASKAPPSSFAEKMFRPILKSRKTAPAVPTFSNLKPAPPSVTTSVASSVIGEGDQSKDRKKLVKKRAPWKLRKEITVQKVQTLEDTQIPPIPAEIQSNLQIRAKELPELEKTFKSQHHVTNRPSMSTMNIPVVDIRFPSPAPQDSPPSRRKSWRSRSREAKHVSPRDSGISQQHAMAIINDFGTAAASLGSNPYDLPIDSTRPRSQAWGPRPLLKSNDDGKKPRPKSMMDDRTAADFARVRSKSIHERDSWNARRASFNDRGGIPGKNLRPSSMISDAPPVPTVPSPEALTRRTSFVPSSPAPLPPPHSPRPSYVETENVFEQSSPAPQRSRRGSYTEYQRQGQSSPVPSYLHQPSYTGFEEQGRPSPQQSREPSYAGFELHEQSSPAPPPPSHSPRPMEVQMDPWAAQAAAWKARRQSAGDVLKRRSWASNPYEEPLQEQAIEEESLYPTIPNRNQPWDQSPPHHRMTRPHSMHPWDHSSKANEQFGPQGHSPNRSIAPYEQHQHSRPHSRNFSPALNNYQSRPQTQYYPPSSYESPNRNLPQPVDRPRDPAQARPRSQAGSFRSFASSIAEELHPNKDERPSIPPEFGRYSGGLSYEFERGTGFGGSAGTRSVSGKADGAHKGVVLRSSHGVDLGDIPVIGVMKRAF